MPGPPQTQYLYASSSTKTFHSVHGISEFVDEIDGNVLNKRLVRFDDVLNKPRVVLNDKLFIYDQTLVGTDCTHQLSLIQEKPGIIDDDARSEVECWIENLGAIRPSFIPPKDADECTHLYAAADGKWRPCSILPVVMMDQQKQVYFPNCGKFKVVNKARLIPMDQELLNQDHKIPNIGNVNNPNINDPNPNINDPNNNPNIDNDTLIALNNKLALLQDQIGRINAGNPAQNVNLIQNPQNIQNPPNVRNNELFAQRLWEEDRLKAFEHKLPRSEIAFYIFSTNLTKYKLRFPKIRDVRIFQAVYESLDSVDQCRWDNWKKKQFIISDVYDANDTVPVREEKEQKFVLDLDTFSNFERWIILDLGFVPHISYFTDKMHMIYYRKNENPYNAVLRFKRYLQEMNDMIAKINAVLPHPIRPNNEGIRISEFVEELYRIIIRDNDSENFDNNGFLNNKVKNKFSGKWGTVTFDNIDRTAIDIADDILPKRSQNPNETGKHWKRYDFQPSIFALKPKNKPNKKRKLDDSAKSEPRNKNVH